MQRPKINNIRKLHIQKQPLLAGGCFFGEKGLASKWLLVILRSSVCGLYDLYTHPQHNTARFQFGRLSLPLIWQWWQWTVILRLAIERHKARPNLAGLTITHMCTMYHSEPCYWVLLSPSRTSVTTL